MSPNTWANIIAAAGAAATLITALSLLIPVLRQVKQVHTIVNQDRTDARNYTAALIRELTRNGIEVPLDQSLPDQDPPPAAPSPGPTPDPGGALTPEEIRHTAEDQAERFPGE